MAGMSPQAQGKKRKKYAPPRGLGGTRKAIPN